MQGIPKQTCTIPLIYPPSLVTRREYPPPSTFPEPATMKTGNTESLLLPLTPLRFLSHLSPRVIVATDLQAKERQSKPGNATLPLTPIASVFLPSFVDTKIVHLAVETADVAMHPRQASTLHIFPPPLPSQAKGRTGLVCNGANQLELGHSLRRGGHLDRRGRRGASDKQS